MERLDQGAVEEAGEGAGAVRGVVEGGAGGGAGWRVGAGWRGGCGGRFGERAGAVGFWQAEHEQGEGHAAVYHAEPLCAAPAEGLVQCPADQRAYQRAAEGPVGATWSAWLPQNVGLAVRLPQIENAHRLATFFGLPTIGDGAGSYCLNCRGSSPGQESHHDKHADGIGHCCKYIPKDEDSKRCDVYCTSSRRLAER